MANGPFGNPLSTGIALSFEVDMTPYREMHKRKLLAAKEKEEDQKKKQQQYADILKNITPPDASKIHKKYMPEVQNQYAELIDSAMGYINNNDVASLHKHMFEFDSNAKKAVQATENYKKYVNSDANKTFKNIEAIRAMEDDNTSIGDVFDKYQNDVEYGDGYLFWSTIEKPDLLGETNKILQGAEKAVVFDGGKPVVMGRMPETDEVIYKESVKDPDKVLDYLSGWLMSSPGGNRLLMEYGGINAGQLDERTPDGMQKRAALAREYVSKEIEPKLYGQKISKIPKKDDDRGSGMKFEDKYTVSDFSEKIKDTQISGIPSGTEMVGKAFNPKGDVTSKAKGGYERLVTVSPDSYESIDGKPIRKPVRSGETITINMVPMGIVALKGSKDDRVFASYRYVTGGGKVPEQIHMHYEPLNRNELKDKNNIEFRDYAGLTDEEFVSYYNEVAGMAGFPKFKGGTSTTGTTSTEMETEEEEDFTQYMRR